MNILSRFFKKKCGIREVMIEKKVYEEWAMSGYEKQKALINQTIYKELNEAYTIIKFVNDGLFPIDINNYGGYDIIIEKIKEYNHSKYYIRKNTTELNNDELALLCDDGNLCFGYNFKGEQNGVKEIYVFEG